MIAEVTADEILNAIYRDQVSAARRGDAACAKGEGDRAGHIRHSREIECVIATAINNYVVTPTIAEDVSVVAAAADQNIIARSGIQHVVARITGDGVKTGAASDHFDVANTIRAGGGSSGDVHCHSRSVGAVVQSVCAYAAVNRAVECRAIGEGEGVAVGATDERFDSAQGESVRADNNLGAADSQKPTARHACAGECVGVG